MGTVKDLISSFVGEEFIKMLKSGTDQIAEELCQLAHNKILEYEVVEFDRNNKTKTILHRSEPVELEKFYQPLFLDKKFNIWSLDSSPDSKARISTEDIRKLFKDNNCITIIGTAGSGKSTLVKYLFVDTLKKKYKIPLKVELRYLNNYDNNLLSYIKDNIIKFTKIAESDRIIERLFDSGQFIIFFDGYDEVASNKKEEITQDICKITKRYPNNNYVLTSRPFVNIEMLEGFHNYKVCNLSTEEIVSFIKKQFNENEQELADRMIETIKEEKSYTYKSFLSNPLLLSMFIITYQTDSYIPQKRSDYYNQVFNTLYSVHDTSSKLGFIRERKSGLSKENYIDILKRFSFKSFFDHKYVFSTAYFEELLMIIKKDLGISFKNEYIIDDFEVAIGILTQEGLDITFPHRSLQEYFAALFITTLSYENKLKVYSFLQKQFMEMLDHSYLQDDYVNFFSLISEMDTLFYQKNIIIPVLNIIHVTVLKFSPSEWKSIINMFVSILSISFLFNENMQNDFKKEDKRYNLIFEKYKAENNCSKIESSDEKRIIIEGCRERLALDDILPFLQKYDYNMIIEQLNRKINKSENNDSTLINSLI